MKPLLMKIVSASALVLALLLLAGLAPVARADGPVDNSYFGIDDGGIVWPYPERLALARGLGAQNLRIALHWRLIERVNTTPENYNWGYSDSIIQKIENGGMIPLVFIGENPKWAAKTPCGPIDTTKPELLAEFAEFIGALAARYPQVKMWTLYNEADHDDVPHHSGGCFGSGSQGGINNNGVPDYAEYAEMAAVARTAIHQANPEAQLSVAVAFDAFNPESCPPDYPGGCSPETHINYNFLPNLFRYMADHPRLNGEPYIDKLTFTYYDIYGPFWERQPSGAGWRGIQAKAAAIRKRMSDAGVTVPLFVTETGDDSQPSWIGLDGQSKCLTMTFVRGIAANLSEVTWWTFADNPKRGWYYGTVDADYNPKPSYTAYQTVVRELSGWTFKSVIRKQGLVEAYKFVRDGKVKLVAWSADAAPAWISPCAHDRSIQVLPLRAKRVLVTDMYGKTKLYRDNKGNDLDPRTNRMKIRLDGTPRYIIRNP